MWCRSGNSKNRKHIKYECQIPFKRCGSGKACSGIADFPPHHGAIRATATGPPQRKVGMVCIPISVWPWTLGVCAWTLCMHAKARTHMHRAGNPGHLPRKMLQVQASQLPDTTEILFTHTLPIFMLPRQLWSFISLWFRSQVLRYMKYSKFRSAMCSAIPCASRG